MIVYRLLLRILKVSAEANILVWFWISLYQILDKVNYMYQLKPILSFLKIIESPNVFTMCEGYPILGQTSGFRKEICVCLHAHVRLVVGYPTLGQTYSYSKETGCVRAHARTRMLGCSF